MCLRLVLQSLQLVGLVIDYVNLFFAFITIGMFLVTKLIENLMGFIENCLDNHESVALMLVV